MFKNKYVMDVEAITEDGDAKTYRETFLADEFSQMVTIFNGMLPDDKSFTRVRVAFAESGLVFLDSDKFVPRGPFRR